LGREILEIFIEKFIDRVRIRKKLIEKINKNPKEFIRVCDEIFEDTMDNYELYQVDEMDFLLSAKEKQIRNLKLIFSAISAQGIPIGGIFYENIESHFRFTITDGEDSEMVLANLISAQLTTLIYSALKEGTFCNYITLNFIDFDSFNERKIQVNFLPLTNDNNKIFNEDNFIFIIISEGDLKTAMFFQNSVAPILIETGLFKDKFTGNMATYEDIKKILLSFPRTLKVTSDTKD
ncbi:MAG: hypothetical protein ACTSXP_13690, partial [Promethearchaeota archaeon]